MKVSILVHDLSDNCVVRTYPIAKVLRRFFDIEVIGPVFGKEVFPAYADEFSYKSLPVTRGGRLPFFFREEEGATYFPLQILKSRSHFELVWTRRRRRHQPDIGSLRHLQQLAGSDIRQDL